MGRSAYYQRAAKHLADCETSLRTAIRLLRVERAGHLRRGKRAWVSVLELLDAQGLASKAYWLLDDIRRFSQFSERPNKPPERAS